MDPTEGLFGKILKNVLTLSLSLNLLAVCELDLVILMRPF